MALRILLVDDFPAIRKALKTLLETHDGWEVVAEAADGREGLREASRLKPDIAVVDVAMPVMNGLDLTRAIRRSVPETEVLIFTQYNNRRMVEEAREAGANGFVLKSNAGSQLISAIAALSEHRSFFENSAHHG